MISVIIPVYNVEPYLAKCINSIKRQTNRHWECIIVDDASPDKCLEMARSMTEGDERFTVIHKEHNEGLSAARNTGMEVAKGDSYCFIDSDDWIEPTTLDHLEATAQTHPDVGRIATPRFVHYPKHGWNIPWSITPTGILKPDSPFPFDDSYCDLGYCTGNLYIPKNIPCKLEFPKVKIFEDLLCNIGLIFAGMTTFVTKDYDYHYERRDDSLICCKYTEEDAEIARQVIRDYAALYNPPQAVFDRCMTFLMNAQNGKLKENG